ncbi:hypothetical protein TWF970_009259 [Orbilia oligospora]|uniref:Checkpoint protein n=1 Tax=Orbilia oligospora TaxID=2813651 RepID=A0A7C8R591_ORBOL|nr:hypothetical protein TWF970_009259 [Orbilia oligospora]
MKFRSDIHNITLLSKVAGSLSVVGKIGWLQLTPSHLQLRVLSTSDNSQSQVWATISSSSIFTDPKISSAHDNIINLEVPLDTLHRSLKSAASSYTSASIKLTKKEGIPRLSVIITTETAASMNHAKIVQDIPVRVLSPQSVAHLCKPLVPRPGCAVMLPPLNQLRGITDRYVKMVGANGRIVVEGNNNGVLKMKLDAEAVKVESEWRGLINPVVGEDGGMEWEDGEEDEEDEELNTQEKERFSKVMVDSRDWAKVVRVSAAGKRVIAWLCNNHSLVVYVFLDEEGDNQATIKYYVSSMVV